MAHIWHDDTYGGKFQPKKHDLTPCARCGQRSKGRTDLCEECQAHEEYVSARKAARAIEPGLDVACFDRYHKPHFGTAMSKAHFAKIPGKDNKETVTIKFAGVPRLVEWPVEKIEILVEVKDES